MKIWMLTIALVTSVGLTACAKKKPADTSGDSDVPKVATTDTQPGEEVRTGLPDPSADSVTLGTIYFELDASTLTEDAKATLAKNADTLVGNVSVTIRVEGHADERGSTQYNLALGQKRANAVKNYLNSLGVATSRMEVVSYGEEKPSATGHDESAWSKNRRVELAVTAGADRVSSSY